MATQVSLNSGAVASAGTLALQTNGTTEAVSISTGQVATLAQNPILTSGTANGVAYLNGSKAVTSGSALTFDGTNFATTGTASATKMIPTGGSATGNGMYLPASNTLAWSNNGSETMRLDSSGNLGLGVTPSGWQSGFRAMQLSGLASWNVDGSTAGSGTYFGNNVYRDSADSRWEYLVTGDNATQYLQASGQHIWRTSASGTAGNAITFTQAMTLDASGNLGVGVTSINASLHVQGAATTDGSISFNQQLASTTAYSSSPASGTMVALKYNSGGSYAGMGGWTVAKENATDGNFASYFAIHTRANGGANTERARIDSSGNLLVGQTSGSYKLSVTGSVYLNALLGTGYNASSEATLGAFGASNDTAVNSSAVYNIEWKMYGDASGQFWRANYIARGGSRTLGAYCTGTAWTNSSDIANKENITSTEYGLATVMASNPVDFQWKTMRDENGVGKKDIGFIAQEMELLVPEVVSGGEGDKGISYGNLVAIAFKAIQEQQTLITTLTERITALEAK
jgi:hypothetical protein